MEDLQNKYLQTNVNKSFPKKNYKFCYRIFLLYGRKIANVL